MKYLVLVLLAGCGGYSGTHSPEYELCLVRNEHRLSAAKFCDDQERGVYR
jgi:hypothetical protein